MLPDSPQDRRRVLVVDDEPHIGRIIQFKLEQGPYDVSMCHDGPAAIEVLRKTDPLDLILLDIMLPQISGLEVLAQLRRLPHRRNTPVIMLTAKGNETDRERAAELGVADFVIKPFSPKKLLARVDEIFRS
jgi:DNA-binding response OmpR family regulator